MIEDAWVNRNHPGDVLKACARARLYVGEMRSCAGFRPETKKEKIDAAQRLHSVGVAHQFSFQIIDVGLQRSETLNLAEKWFAQQSLKVSHEIQRMIHPQGRQCVLGENVKAAKHIIKGRCLRQFAYEAIQRLGASAAYQNHDHVPVLLRDCLSDFFQLDLSDSLLARQNLRIDPVRLERRQVGFTCRSFTLEPARGAAAYAWLIRLQDWG